VLKKENSFPYLIILKIYLLFLGHRTTLKNCFLSSPKMRFKQPPVIEIQNLKSQDLKKTGIPPSFLRIHVQELSLIIWRKFSSPFLAVNPAGEGTGLGLSIVDQIVRGHNGNIRVESTPGAGTTFYVTLPISRI